MDEARRAHSSEDLGETMAAKLKRMLILAAALGAAESARAQCPPDSVEVGPLCVDKFETSVWSTTNGGLIKRIKDGVVRLAQLQAAGATQHGAGTGLGDAKCDYEPGCPQNAAGCVDFYAVSIPNVVP